MHAGRLVAGPLDVLDVGTGIGVQLDVGPAFASQLQHPVAQPAQEHAVVRHEDHRAVELRQRIDQHFLRRQIQVVGRLVEHQEVRRVEQHARHDEARLLASRQRPDLLLDVLAGELKRAEQVAQRADGLERKILLDLLPDRELGIEQLRRLLREVAHLHAGADTHVAPVRRQRAGDHLQQRRLAGAVPAHHRPSLAAPDRQVDAVVDHATAVGLRQILKHRDLLAGARRLAEVEIDDAPLLRQLDLLDLVERLDAALHLRRLCGVRGEAFDEPLLLGEHRLLPGVGRLAIRLADARARARRSRSCPSRR